MRSALCSALFGLAIAVGTSSPVTAGCWCDRDGWPIYCWTDVIPEPGSTVTWTNDETLVTVGPLVNGSCTGPGATAPTKECKANAGTKTIRKWEVTAGDANLFGLSGTIGEEDEASADCNGSGVTISDWCQCCFTRAALRWKWTYKEGLCSCDAGWVLPQCGSEVSGTLKEFDHVVCDELPCSVPDNCKTDCEEGA